MHSNQIKEYYYHKLAYISHLNQKVVTGLNRLNEKEKSMKEKEIKMRRMNSLNELMISKYLFLLKSPRM